MDGEGGGDGDRVDGLVEGRDFSFVVVAVGDAPGIV